MRKQVTKSALALACCVAAVSQAAEEETIARFESLIKAGQFDVVAAEAPQFIEAHPRSWKACYQLGYVYFRLHQNWRSLLFLSKSLAVNDQFAESHKILALDLNILGKQSMAVTELEKAVALDPQCAECHYELGRMEYERGAYLGAVRHLEAAKSLNPTSVRTYHNLGLAYAAVGRTGDAEASFQQGLRLNDTQAKPSAWPLIDYATYLNMQNEFPAARDLLLRAVAIDNRWDQAYSELSKCYRGLNETGNAIAALKQAIALNPDKAEYHYVLARLYRQTHQPEQASAELAQYASRKSKELPR